MKKPKLVVPKNLADYLAEGLSFIAILISFVLPLIYYPQLPEELPIHFDATGTADRFGPKLSLIHI